MGKRRRWWAGGVAPALLAVVGVGWWVVDRELRPCESGRRLAMLAPQVGGRDTDLRVWQLGSSTPILSLSGSRFGSRSAWSPDEHLLAVLTDSGDGDGIALLMDDACRVDYIGAPLTGVRSEPMRTVQSFELVRAPRQ